MVEVTGFEPETFWSGKLTLFDQCEFYYPCFIDDRQDFFGWESAVGWRICRADNRIQGTGGKAFCPIRSPDANLRKESMFPSKLFVHNCNFYIPYADCFPKLFL